MVESFTWLQISDIHFRIKQEDGAFEDSLTKVSQALLKLVEKDNLTKRKIPQIDAVFVVGDVAFSGEESQYDKAFNFLNDLMGVLGISIKRIFAVPGNHDIDYNVKPANQRVPFTPDDATNMLKTKRDENFYPFFKQYNSAAKYIHSEFSPDRLSYVQSISLDNLEIAVVGLNTAINSIYVGKKDEKDSPAGSRSTVGFDENQGKVVIGEGIVDEAYGIIKKSKKTPDFVITLGHHPLEWISDDKDRNTRTKILQNSDFYLSGHIHDATFRYRIENERQWGFYYLTSGALHVDKKNRHTNTVMICNIETDKENNFTLKIWPFYYAENPNPVFAPDHELDKFPIIYHVSKDKEKKKNQEELEMHAQILPEESLARKYVDILIDGFKANLPVRTMWVMDYSGQVKEKYIHNVFPAEQKAIRNKQQITRVFSNLDLVYLLEHIGLHKEEIRRRMNYHLYVPKIDPDTNDFEKILLSEDVCPSNEMVFVGTRLYIHYKEQSGMNGFKEISGSEIKYHSTNWDWFASEKRCDLIKDESSLNSWLKRLETAISRIDKINEEKVLPVKNLINAIRTFDLSSYQLDEGWWDFAAPKYEPEILNRKIPFMEKFHREEFELIKKQFLDYTKSHNKPTALIEIGCGTGRFLRKFVTDLNTKISCVIGVDYSKGMINECDRMLEDEAPAIPRGFVTIDAQKWNKVMINGQINKNPDLESCIDLNANVQGLLEKSQKFVCMLGTLENISDTKRLQILRNIRNSLNEGDILVVSAYNGDKFSEEAYSFYRQINKVVGDTVLAYDVDYMKFASMNEDMIFYTNWLTKSQLQGYMKNAGFVTGPPSSTSNAIVCFGKV